VGSKIVNTSGAETTFFPLCLCHRRCLLTDGFYSGMASGKSGNPSNEEWTAAPLLGFADIGKGTDGSVIDSIALTRPLDNRLVKSLSA